MAQNEEILIQKKLEPHKILEKDIILISHQKDFDGIGSAAIAKIAFGSKISRIIFSDFGGDAALELSEELKKILPQNSAIMFVDISLNENAADIYDKLLETLKSKNNLIVWLDHHPLGEKARKVLEKHADLAVAGEQKICGAEVFANNIIEPLGLSNKNIKIIEEMAHASDFNLSGQKYDDKLKKISEAIASYLDEKDRKAMQSGLIEITNTVANDAENFEKNNLIRERAEYYEKKQKELKEELAKHIYVVGNKIKAVVGFNVSGSLQTNDGCNFLFENAKDAEIAVYVKLNLGTVHFRRRDSSVIDLSIIAQRLDGNGHPPASAGKVPEAFKNIKEEKEMREFAKYLGTLVSEIYEKSKIAKP